MNLKLRKNTSAAGFWVIVALVIGAIGPVAAKAAGLDEVPSALISADSGKPPEYAVIVEKSTQNLYLYRFGQTAEFVLRFVSSTGEFEGPKSREGDRKTPEGIYFFTREHPQRDLAPIYGTRAFPIDYPNLLDRIAGRDGNSIWMHGTNKPLKPKDTNGCVALENIDIDKLAEYITLNRTPLIIVEKLKYVPVASSAEIKKSLDTFLLSWKAALENGSYHDYLMFYDDAYLPDISWWPAWLKLKNMPDSSVLPLQVDLKNIMLLKHKAVYVALFDQVVKTADAELPAGTRKLFMTQRDNRLRIIGDVYQLLPEQIAKDSKTSSPLVAAGLELGRIAEIKMAARRREEEAAARRREEEAAARRKAEVAALSKTTSAAGRKEDAASYRLSAVRSVNDREIQEMVDGWLKAWSSKDIEAYGGYYAKNFRSQGGASRRAWLNYKNRLNRRYTYIHVTRGELSVNGRKNKRLVTFTQDYESSGMKTAGTKQLVVIQEKGRWKIYREIWQKK